MQPRKRIMDVITKNNTAFLSVNIIEVIYQKYKRIQVELKSVSYKTFTETVTVTVTETVTVNKYVRHRNIDCCLYMIGEI